MLWSKLQLTQKPKREGERNLQAEGLSKGRATGTEVSGTSGWGGGESQGVVVWLETGRAARISICSQQNLVSTLLIIYPLCNFSYQ